MCFDEGKLLAYLDDELTAEERTAIEEHLATCERCAASVRGLNADRAFAERTLERLQPSAEVVELPPLVRPAPAFAWGRIAAAAAAVLVLGSFAFAPVRTAAADLLRVFRVQKVQTISLSQDDLQQIGKTLQTGSGHIDLKSLGDAWVEGGPRDTKQVSLAEAQSAVDFPVKLPTGLGEPQLQLQPGQTVRFKLHVDAVNEALRYYGSDRTLPSSVDGKVFEVQVPPILTARYGDAVGKRTVGPEKGHAFADGVFVGQARSPQLTVPDGVDAAQLREVLLNLPFIPQNVRDQLAAVDDWQSTLLVPNVGGSAQDVTIDGIPAVVMSPDGAIRSARAKVGTPLPENVTTVIWNQDGVIRAIAGSIDETRATALARTCMK
jgi:hypothetical protein